MASKNSPFMKENVPRLLDRFELSYYKESNCVEYFITDKSTKKQVSYSVVLSLNTYSKEIHVSHFYPELSKQSESKYLSAAFFYLLIHHFGHIYHLDNRYHISLDTRPDTYDRFFSKLKNFHLRNNGIKLCETVAVLGDYPPRDINTSIISKRHSLN